MAPSVLVAKIALPNSAFITNTYDNNGRMLGTYLYNSSASALDSSVYTYNVGNQRASVTRTGENAANYAYDPIGQVIADQASEVSGGANRLNEQLHYIFDPAGNLSYRTNNALVANFHVNSVNELTANTNGGTLTVVGTTTSPASSVTVNSTSASLYGDATFAAGGLPLTTTYTATASDSYGRHSTNAVSVSLSTNVTFQYDGNGNLTNDGLRNFVYDDENELIQVSVSNAWMSRFSYDGKMRRRIRQEFTWLNSTWTQTNQVYYVYDGNLVIQERDINNLPTTTYTRGNDLSGSFEGAGGIGGLLARTSQSYSDGPLSGNSFYHADGNGNITMLIDDFQGIVAKYLYDAFGNTISKSGLLADANVYRFSSKEWHQNSGLAYYLYRYFDPNLQRWPNRDPIGERGGLDLYSFTHNRPINRIDRFGFCSEAIGKNGLPRIIFENADGGWDVTSILFDAQGADEADGVGDYQGLTLTWQAHVIVLCTCDCSKKGPQPGIRTFTANLNHEFFVAKAGSTPIDIPSPTSLVEAIGESAAAVIGSNISRPIGVQPADINAFASLAANEGPTAPTDGKWLNGKSPCK